MRNTMDGFNSLLQNKRVVSTDQVDGPQEGHVLTVDTVNRLVTVTLTNSIFGTDKSCQLDYDRSITPIVGDKCLMVFVGGGVDRGWLVASKPDS